MKRLCSAWVRVKGHVFSKKKITFLLLAATVVTLKVAAQGEQGLQAAEQTIKGYFPYAVNLMYAIGALVGIVGAVKV